MVVNDGGEDDGMCRDGGGDDGEGGWDNGEHCYQDDGEVE